MNKFFSLLFILLVAIGCKREFEAPVPDVRWDLFYNAAARLLPLSTRDKMEGIYNMEQGREDFGTAAAAKWSYTVNGADTTFHLSFFCEENAAYIICEGRQLDSTILLSGYWRKMVSSETGSIRLTIGRDSGARSLLRTTAMPTGESILITGFYGNSNEVPATPIRLRYSRMLFKATPFQVLAHRGGGRTADLLPASENSAEMIKLASRFGATGVEIDVRLTSDGIPILFHDATLNERVIQKNGLLGPIENYSFAQLSALVKLPKGERIPTLREALHTVVYNTSLRYVWLDMKYDGSFQLVRDLQTEFLNKAAALNKPLEIVLGLPDEKALANFKNIANYTNTPSLVEFSPSEATAVNAKVWAPQWTLGLQKEEVSRLQSQGRRVFSWTLDVPENIQRYIKEGGFNGVLSNYPSVVAYHYYAQ